MAKDSADKLPQIQLIFDEYMVKVIDLQNKSSDQSVTITELGETLSLQIGTISSLNKQINGKNQEILSL